VVAVARKVEWSHAKAPTNLKVYVLSATACECLVEDLRQDWENGAEVGARRDEVERNKVLHDRLVVAADQMRHRLDHSKLDVVIHLSLPSFEKYSIETG
jgi:hypothetical protein